MRERERRESEMGDVRDMYMQADRQAGRRPDRHTNTRGSRARQREMAFFICVLLVDLCGVHGCTSVGEMEHVVYGNSLLSFELGISVFDVVNTE